MRDQYREGGSEGEREARMLGFEFKQRGCEKTCVAAARMTGWSTTVSSDEEKRTTRVLRR